MIQTEQQTQWADAWPVFQIEWVQSAWRIRKTSDLDIDTWPSHVKNSIYGNYLIEIGRLQLTGLNPALRMAANLARRMIDYEVRKQMGAQF